MATVPTLPLNIVVDVEVEVSPQAPASPTFNQGLVIGTTDVIPSVGANSRIRQYSTLAQIAADGFSTTDPEYLAAQTYFGQNANGPAPQILWLGRQDLTALSDTGTAVGSSGGTNYQANDIVTVVQSDAQLGMVEILTVSGGVVETIQVIDGFQGTGYTVATGLAVTGGHGTGLLINLTSVGETVLEAAIACRAASPAWWAFAALAAVTADNEAIAAWAQSEIPSVCYFYQTSDAAVLTGVGDVFSYMKTSSYNRVFGIYSTTQSGSFPNNIYAAVAAMGVAMGLNTGLAGSYFTLKFKELVGITTEPLSQSIIGIIEGNNGNLYLSYANTYQWVEQGKVGNGQFFDEILNLDMLASNIQYNIINLLTETPSVPQTDAGQTQLLNQVNAAGAASASIGFLAGAVWEGQQVLNVSPGSPIPLGYLAVSPKYSTQSPADRQARKSMPIYMLITEAGAVHSVLVGVYVQR
jgi:hypothetical protein